jgi:hypothetical protein
VKESGSAPLPSAPPSAAGTSTIKLAITSALGALAIASIAFLLVFWDEVLLAAPIIFLVKVFGFWPACVIFACTWAVMNVTSLTIFDHAWVHIQPKLVAFWHSLKAALGMKPVEAEEEVEEDSVEKAKSWRMRIVLWMANVFRPLGAIATGVFLGGPFGVAVYRALGYKGWTGYAWTLAMTPVYALIWVSFYGQGGIAVIDLLQDLL